MNKIMKSDSCWRTIAGTSFNSALSLNWKGIPKHLETTVKSISSMALLFVLFLFSTVSSAQVTIDGNPSDWDRAVFNTFPIRSYVLDPYGNGQVDNQYTSSKDFFLADGKGSNHLTWVMGQTKAKNDISNAAAVLKNNTLYFAGYRTSNNGDAQIGFWFFLDETAPRTLQKSRDGGDFATAHTVGDLL